MTSIKVAVLGSCFLASSVSLYAVPINVLTNPGFETGDFAGWAIDGSSTQFGVAADGVLIAGDEFGQGVSNVRSGVYSAYAQVKGNPQTVLTLSQTIAVLPGESVDLGFFVGHAEGTAIGVNGGTGSLKHTKIIVDGVELALNNGDLDIPGGQDPSDFLQISGVVNTGTRTELNVTFQLDGSGTKFADNSFDDFYAITENPLVANGVPEGGATILLTFAAATATLAAARKRGA
jgi:hypothetical protein